MSDELAGDAPYISLEIPCLQLSSTSPQIHTQVPEGMPVVLVRSPGLILFRVQTESTGKVAAVVIARIEREPEGLRTGKES